SLFGSPWAIPYGDVGAITFMGHLMRRQMHEHGLESLDYAHIAVTWRKHAMNNPHAQMRKPMTIEDHQNSRFINEPMRLFDCCLFTDGGARLRRGTGALVRGDPPVRHGPWQRPRGGRADLRDGRLRSEGHRRRPD